VGLFAGLCILAGPGCQTSAGPEQQEAAGVVERLRSHRMNVKQEGAEPRAVLPPAGKARVERVEGGLSVKVEKPSRGDSRRPARVVLPEVAQRPFRVKDLASGLTMDVTLEGAGAAKAEVVDGYVVYPDAYPGGADVVHRFTPEGTEDYLSFERAPSVPEVRYGLSLGAGSAGLRLVEDTLEVLDGSGAPRLRMAPPYLVGADGRVTQAHVSVEGCAVDTRASAPWQRPVTVPGSRQCRVRVAWNDESVKYPAVLDPVWSTTGSLSLARGDLTTTVLADGRVLAVAGINYQVGMLSSAEVYDPATGTWATTSSLATGRMHHSATLLDSGKVLVSAGWSPNYETLGTTELYDPATGTWSSAGSLNTARYNHSTVLLSDGRVLASGGGPSLVSAELYDPATDIWAPTGSLTTPRELHGLLRLSNGKVLAAGGKENYTHDLYDPATGTWTATGSMVSAVYPPLVAPLPDGRVLVTGGYEPLAEVYDPATDSSSPTATPPLVRLDATVSVLPDGRVLIAGGGNNSSYDSQMGVTQVYDPTTGTWSLGAILQEPRSGHSASVLQDGRVLVVGGRGISTYGPLASAEVLLLDVDDVTAPLVTVSSPSEGASVEREVILTVSASDDYGVKRVEYFDGDTLIGTATSAPFSLSWYTQWYGANGPHVLTARAYDAAGNVGTSAPVSVIVDNDKTAPTVTVTSPAADSTQQGVITLSADAVDERGVVSRVEFWDGRKYLGTDFDAPFSMTWDLANVPGGPHSIVAKAFDPDNNLGTHSVSITVSQPGTATYDSTLQVPRCGMTGTIGSVCDSGSYLTGRGTVEFELNPPNTLQGSCADGLGYYDTYVDRIRISTTDGSALEVGKSVNIAVTVRAIYSYSMESLDLYAAADATNPVWTHLATLGPTRSGDQTLSILRTLPAGAVQAVRARFRYGGSQAPCGSGDFDDHDDLVFRVLPDMTAPTVSLTAPATGATVMGTTTLSASAYDALGVLRVEFFDGTTLLGTDTTPPYSLSWNTAGLSNGSHTLSAKAYDAAGNAGQSASVSVTVVNDVTSPTVSLTSPTSGSTLSGGWATLSASASDNVGVSRVEFFDGTTLLGTDTSAPYSMTWSTMGVPNGSHTLSAKAYDAAGNAGQSAPVTITMANDVTPPTVSITSPTSGSTQAGTTTISVSASDNVGVSRVQYFDGATLLGTSTSSPHYYSWNLASVATGSHTLTAKAFDSMGNSTTSAPVTVTVIRDTTAPTVSITAPTAGATVSGTVSYSASASDNVGVSWVQFYDGANLLLSDTTAPFSISWNTVGLPNGTHTLKVTAHDASGNVGQSTLVQVTVNNPVATGMAAYDSMLGAPRCGSAGISCDSGTLLNGRASLGPEANAPNTVDTCTDGTGGSYHSDESLDRLKVSTLDGTTLAAGKTVRIDATVWGFSSYSLDALDLYYAPDANAPSWTLIGTVPATGAGSHVLSKTYTLPSGSTARAVVRGVFRYGGSASTCPSGSSYTDVDDLVFNAQ
jgi:hypothetical protein